MREVETYCFFSFHTSILFDGIDAKGILRCTAQDCKIASRGSNVEAPDIDNDQSAPPLLAPSTISIVYMLGLALDQPAHHVKAVAIRLQIHKLVLLPEIPSVV